MPLPRLPMYEAPPDQFPNAEQLGGQGLNLPSGARLTDLDLEYVSAAIHDSALR